MNHDQKTIFGVARARTRSRRTVERTLMISGMVGAAVAAGAMLWPQRQAEPIASPVEAPIEAAPAAIERAEIEVTPVEVVTLAETVVASPRPTVVIAHDEPDLDHQAISKERIESGDLRGGFDALRKHLYVSDPTAPVLLQLGRIGLEIKELAIAEQALLDAAALDPADAEVQVVLGRVLLAAGEIGEARAAARQAIRLDRDNPAAWNLAGRVAMAESEWHRAEMALRQALQLEPTDPMLHNNLGLLYVMMRKGPDAVDSLETSAELYDEDAPAFVLNNLGLAYELAGRHTDARDAFERAVLANPSYSRAQVNLRRVAASIADRAEAEAAGTRSAQLEEERPEPTEQGLASEDESALW